MKQLIIIGYIIEFVPLLFCIYFRNKINTKYLKVFFLFLTFLALFSTLIITNRYQFKSPKLHYSIINLYSILECTFFTLFFYYLYKSNTAKKIILIFSIPLVSFYIFNYFTNEKFNVQSLFVQFSFFTVVILYYFLEKLNNITTYSFFKSISFWLCIGLFFYFMGNFTIVIFSKSSTDKVFLNQIQIIYFLVLLIKDSIFSLAWLGKEPIETDADIIVIPKGLKIDYDPTYTPTANDTNP